MMQNPLNVQVGDTVRIDFRFFDRHPFLAQVTKVRDRASIGQDVCITYVPEESGRDLRAEEACLPYICSVSHVTEMVKRGKAPATFHNVFRENAENERKEYGRNEYWGVMKEGGIYICIHLGLARLIMRALATVHGTLDRDLDLNRFFEQWARDQFRGKVRVPGGTEDFAGEEVIAVRWKTFRKYVIANRHRILHTRKEMETAGEAYHEAMLALWKDVEHEFR